MTPAQLIDKLKDGHGSDYELNADIAVYFQQNIGSWPPEYTSSIDACVSLIAKVLPGWWWSCGLCGLSGDGSIKFHGSLGPDHDLSHDVLVKFDAGFHNDLYPGDGISRVCRALLCCIIEAKEAVDAYEKEKEDA